MPRQNLPLILLLFTAALINLAGVFGPELGFDALWYHLTIPKLYLLAGQIYHIPGGLLYYSEMPRLTEILYIPLLKYFGEVGPHLLSWTASIATTIIIYKLARKLGLSSFFSFISSIIFYVTPLVGWQSGSAYVDLFRTLFEVLALYFVFNEKYLVAGLATGLAISTKTLALGSVLPLILVIFVQSKNLRSCILYLASCILVAIPWFLSAYLNTGYPFYPIGAGILDASHNLNLDLWNLPKVLGDFWKLWLAPEDPISPIYLITLPFIIVVSKKFSRELKLFSLFPLISYVIWYIIPRTGGGRFILPYLPAFAVLVGATIESQKDKWIKNLLITLIIFISLINLTYRLAAESKLLPYLLGRQTKTAYLCKNLDLKVTYVNCFGFKPVGFVYVRSYHNLYYLDFPFVHETWYRREKYYDVISP